MRGCRQARRAIPLALERELPLEKRLELERHLALCPECAELHARALAVEEALERLGQPPERGPDVERALANVRAALEPVQAAGRRAQASAGPGRRGARIAAGIAALLAAAALLWFARGAAGPEEQGDSGVAASATEPPSTPEEVERSVREHLRLAFAGVDQDQDPGQALARFQQATRDLARSGWPLRRYVEDLLEDPELDVARPAAIVLGELGDPLSAVRLERALDRAGLERAALSTLGALGEPAVPVLSRTLDRPALATLALRELCRIGGRQASAAIERRLQRPAESAGANGVPSREALLDALTATGPSAVASLLELAQEDPTGGQQILARLPLVKDGGDELVRLLEHERHPRELLYEALALLVPAGALPWLAERCGEYRERPRALATLERWRGPAPLATVLELEQSGRVPRDDLVRLLRELVRRDAERLEEFTGELLARVEPFDEQAQRWLDLLLDTEAADAGRALVLLALSGDLPDDDRQWAALALAEIGTVEDARALAAGLEDLGPGDRRLFAAALVAIHRHLGVVGVERALGDLDPLDVRRVLLALDGLEERGGAVGLHKVARALEGGLNERTLRTSNRTP